MKFFISVYKPKVGDKVTFEGYTIEQVRWGNNDEPTMLTVGYEYFVEEVEEHNHHTKVKLVGYDGYFNSVHFTK